MNKETTKVIDYIDNNEFYLNKIKELRNKYTNIKDFQLLLQYDIMDLLSRDERLINLTRSAIDLNAITKKYF